MEDRHDAEIASAEPPATAEAPQAEFADLPAAAPPGVDPDAWFGPRALRVRITVPMVSSPPQPGTPENGQVPDPRFLPGAVAYRRATSGCFEVYDPGKSVDPATVRRAVVVSRVDGDEAVAFVGGPLTPAGVAALGGHPLLAIVEIDGITVLRQPILPVAG